MTPQQIAERIEDWFDDQLDSTELEEALEALQEDLIGADAVEAMRAARFKKYQDEHPWLYPEIYGPVERPAAAERLQILTPQVLAKEMLSALQANLGVAAKVYVPKLSD